MTGDQIISALCLPADSLVNQRVPKKLLLENGAPTATDKRHITQGIDELLWLAALKPATIGVPIYRDDTREYLEIAVLSLTLKQDAKYARLTELIHRAIPYPILLIQEQAGSVSISLAHIRWSQGEAGRMVLDGEPLSVMLNKDSQAAKDFLYFLKVSNQPRSDLRSLYQGWINHAEAFLAASLSGRYLIHEDGAMLERRRAALVEHDRLTRKIAVLRADAAKETQLNRRVDKNLEIKKLETLLNQTVQSL